MLMSSTSCVMTESGIRSVNTLLSTIITQEYRVNCFPMYRNPMYTGTTFSSRLMGVNGGVTWNAMLQARWSRIVSPVIPPG